MPNGEATIQTNSISNWQGYNNGSFCGVYPVSRLTEAMDELLSHDIMLAEASKHDVFNIPCAFDIETSSFYNDSGDKCACMYIWQFGIDGITIYGRVWEEFIYLLEQLMDYLGLSHRRKLVIYVHNLGYEFQFIRKWFEWDRVFAIKNRRPVYCITGPFEFRCSLFLSNYSLEKIGDSQLNKYPVKKLTGSLDYSKVRHSQTPLTDSELAYCVNDVRVVMSYIQEKIEHDGSIIDIPLTNTGYVRRYCRLECYGKGENKKKLLEYRALMKSLRVSSVDEYKQMERAFMGGFTHASAIWSNKILTTPEATFQSDNVVDDMESGDIISSYPGEMVRKYFPMTSFEYVGIVTSESEFQRYLSDYCCIFDIEFTDLQPAVTFENVLSLSRCQTSGKVVVNNGRIVSAELCRTTLTELDYDTVSKFYKWSKKRVINLRIAHRGYLPRDLILAVLNLYQDKTELKGVLGKEVEYLVSKNMINAAFGMMVTSIIRKLYSYSSEDDIWSVEDEADVLSRLTSYNKNFNRFLYYGWGIYVTAHARHSLFKAIYEFGEDYIYSDTDSIKGMNFSKHLPFFKRYNDEVYIELARMCQHYNIDFNMCRPKTSKGEEKVIGTWEIDARYCAFKTAGAKRYMYEYPDGKLSMTVAGVNKKYALPYLLSTYGSNEMVFYIFGDGMFIPEGNTGKQSVTYIDEFTTGLVKDYLGQTIVFNERSSIHMEPQSFYMSLIGDYLKFLEGVEYVEL